MRGFVGVGGVCGDLFVWERDWGGGYVMDKWMDEWMDGVGCVIND